MQDFAARVRDIRRPETCENKWPDKKNLLAMAIVSDMKAGGESPGSISRSYEGVGNRFLCLYFDRRLRSALRSHGLPFQRIGSKRASIH